MAASVRTPGVVWVVEDGGIDQSAPPVVHAFDPTGAEVATVTLAGWNNRDIEALVDRPGPALWVADIGDNTPVAGERRRAHVRRADRSARSRSSRCRTGCATPTARATPRRSWSTRSTDGSTSRPRAISGRAACTSRRRARCRRDARPRAASPTCRRWSPTARSRPTAAGWCSWSRAAVGTEARVFEVVREPDGAVDRARRGRRGGAAEPGAAGVDRRDSPTGRPCWSAARVQTSRSGRVPLPGWPASRPSREPTQPIASRPARPSRVPSSPGETTGDPRAAPTPLDPGSCSIGDLGACLDRPGGWPRGAAVAIAALLVSALAVLRRRR